MSENQVLEYKNEINKTLGKESSTYWAFIKKWLKQIYTEEELNALCLRMFRRSENFMLHNNFMMALKNRIYLKATFGPAQVNDYVPIHPCNPRTYLYGNKALQPETYSSEEKFLPDRAMVLGRLLIALDDDLEDATEAAAEMIVEASQTFLKCFVKSILTKYRSYSSYEGVKYNIGRPVPNPWHEGSINELARAGDRSCFRMNLEEFERTKMFAASTSERGKKPLTVKQIYDALKADKGILPNHSIYAMAIEGIMTGLGDSESDDDF